MRNKFQQGVKRGASRMKQKSASDAKVKKPDFKKRPAEDDEEISSHSEDENDNDNSNEYTDEDEEEQETPQEKRLRLAKEYLKEIEAQGNNTSEPVIHFTSINKIFYFAEKERAADTEVDKSVIAHRVKEDLLEQSGKLRRTVADLYEEVDTTKIRHLHCKEHKLPITCMAVSSDCQWLFTASKDCNIVKWSLADMKKVAVLKRVDRKAGDNVKGHKTVVQSVAISSDGKFFASGDLENVIHIWDPTNMKWLHTFKGTCF